MFILQRLFLSVNIRLPSFSSCFWADTPACWIQKAPEGGCSPGKKGLMILYLFVVVGVLDLERNCHVALLAVALNNYTNVRPIAILADVNIRTGIDPL